jgi:uncharacterized protein YyaL (SSP411 family)
MAHESFESDAIAAQMNRLFVCVKVDREERPDLDQIYQLTVQLMGRSGGWPLTVFLTPDQRPFYAGTYFPPQDKYGMPGFPKILDAIADAYAKKRDEVESQAGELAGAIARVTQLEMRASGEPYTLGPDLLERAVKATGKRFDDVHGGFGTRPKFPNSMALDVLLRRSVEGERDLTCEQRVKRALVGMRNGGIYDQLGGGFHRYSTDERWLVPHFEKMLYDNALLARLYADASRCYGEARFASVSKEIVTYLAREMVAADGAFFSTQDADSVPLGAPPGTHPEEGAFFVWTPEQIRDALGADDEAAKVAILHFGVTARGNFEESGASVLSEVMPIEDVAQQLSIGAEDTRGALERARASMLQYRAKRPAPFRDEKVLAAWNGLMIGACAEVAMATGDAAALAMAERAFAAIEQRLIHEGTVYRVSPPPGREVATKIAGYLDDYAFLACAALDLYEATARPRYVEIARALVRSANARFHDDALGGYFFTPSDGERLIHRGKDPFDQAIPSGQSMMALALLRLFALDGDASLEERARKTLEPLASAAVSNALGLSQTLVALDRLMRGSTDVVVVGARDDARTSALLDAVRRAYVPHRTLVLVDPSDPATRAAAPALAEGKEQKSHPVAYVCRGRTCSPPVADATALSAALEAKK